ncbi:MAG: hypothetical protein A2X25_08360 [Chloroflexi bacterium GWB2_49_20]|nr:MAG: hypothetical protein A2X25_08360 [Chloroflexi bacterium GWB2_49_20]OGN79552.1 MAG: hypothetical protein A2X26_05665 [Chloroflexi bacterium GWC2_49_37]OGN84525.1 MAG: hypothetical protein A2X27_10865 [Chloroflexi bacterium GWD2_49_16]HBG74052.1 hypothetical protein [Anaerolineae bacterium]HCC78854.1 hypothetical protein [Anaerolineae bacterium]
MTHTLLIHLQNEDPIVGEVEELPSTTDQLITVNNPRRRDGKDVHYLESNVMAIILPILRITFIELIKNEMDEEIVSFVKD